MFLRRLIVCLALALIAAPPPAPAQGQGSGMAPEDLAWAEVLLMNSPDAPESEVHGALAALKAQAAGLLEDPATREAAFILANYWSVQAADEPSEEAIRAISAAATLYPDDPRSRPLLEQLVTMQVETGDCFGAHIMFARLVESDLAERRPDLAVQAAYCAADSRDFAAALEWSRRIDLEQVDAPLHIRLDLARLKSEEALGRLDVALKSAKRLEENDLDALHGDRLALLAAARARENATLLEPAVKNYATYVNLYPKSADRPTVLLKLAALLGRMGRLVEAQRYIDFLISEYPDSMEADQGRLSAIEFDGGSARASQLDTYLAVIRDAGDVPSTRVACQRLVDRFLSAGLPLELMMGLSRLIREESDNDGSPVVRMVAEDATKEALELILTLLVSREDVVSIGAVSIQAMELGIPIPASRREDVRAARRTLGLPPLDDRLAPGIEAARELMQTGSWQEAADHLALELETHAEAEPRQAATARRLQATALWRADRSEEALQIVDDALQAELDRSIRRSFHVLRADILFGAGEEARACTSYREAAALGASAWVTAQTERCPDLPARPARRKS